MRIVHLSYAVPKPRYTDPNKWLRRINSSIGVLESMTKYAEIVGIYHIHYKGTLERNKVLYHFPGFNRWQLLLPIKFNQFVKSLSPDVVIIHGLIFPWQVVMLKFQLGSQVKIIAQHHAEKPFNDIRQYFQRWADRYIKAYLFCSFDLGKRWIDRNQIYDPRKIKEIMGTSSPFYPMKQQEARSNTKVFGESAFLWVGGLDSNKDPLTVVKAFIRFANANHEVELFMIFQTFELLDELKKLIENTSGASKYIHLIGEVDNKELQYWYNSVDFIISSSHYEGSGIAVCEGLSCGCIPILTNIPSFRMMTDNGRIGLLYEAGNEEALFTKFLKSLEIDKEEMKALVLEHFNNHLSFDANAKSIMKVISEIE
jgi:glycosyltransferase involved in cell wall biosynthesis